MQISYSDAYIFNLYEPFLMFENKTKIHLPRDVKFSMCCAKVWIYANNPFINLSIRWPTGQYICMLSRGLSQEPNQTMSTFSYELILYCWNQRINLIEKKTSSSKKVFFFLIIKRASWINKNFPLPTPCYCNNIYPEMHDVYTRIGKHWKLPGIFQIIYICKSSSEI